MRLMVFFLIAELVGCATESNDTSNLPLCSELGCEYAICSSVGIGSRCVCGEQSCVFAPSCASLGCDDDHPPTCTDRISCTCDIDGTSHRCERFDATP